MSDVSVGGVDAIEMMVSEKTIGTRVSFFIDWK